MTSDSGRPGGRPTPDPKRAPAPGRRPSSSKPTRARQERREALRRDARLSGARTTAVATPPWRSPMVLLTGGAVVIGLLVILVASGVFSPKAKVGDLLVPIYKTPTSLADPTNPLALGQANAPVTVEIFSDFQCPACKFFTTSTEAAFLNQYVATGKARFVYRDMTIIDGGDPAGESSQAAIAARCAGDQGAFWPFHDYLFENQDPAGENKGWFTQSRLQAIADAVGLDRTKFDACTSNGAAKLAAVQADTTAGKALGVGQTPTLGVNGKLLTPGAVSISTLGAAVDAALGGSPSPGTSGSPAPSASSAPSPSPSATP